MQKVDSRIDIKALCIVAVTTLKIKIKVYKEDRYD